MPAQVVVVGSLNIDYIANVTRLPGGGETVFANGLVQRFGGKGANQAIAAARQGARVAVIACVGEDDHGRSYCKRLEQERVDASGVATTSKALTGTALIAVDASAENMIIVAPGANGELKPAAVRRQRACIQASKAVLLQQEIPAETVLESICLANAGGIPVILNPSPLRDDFPWGKCTIDTLIANAGEAQAIFGISLAKLSSGFNWAAELAKRQIARLIITRGSKPTICIEPNQCFEVPTLSVEPVDTVGAGDAFAGTFAARRAQGCCVADAIRYANCSGALATLKPGAQESIPTRSATEKALKRLR